MDSALKNLNDFIGDLSDHIQDIQKKLNIYKKSLEEATKQDITLEEHQNSINEIENDFKDLAKRIDG